MRSCSIHLHWPVWQCRVIPDKFDAAHFEDKPDARVESKVGCRKLLGINLWLVERTGLLVRRKQILVTLIFLIGSHLKYWSKLGMPQTSVNTLTGCFDWSMANTKCTSSIDKSNRLQKTSITFNQLIVDQFLNKKLGALVGTCRTAGWRRHCWSCRRQTPLDSMHWTQLFWGRQTSINPKVVAGDSPCPNQREGQTWNWSKTLDNGLCRSRCWRSAISSACLMLTISRISFSTSV